MPDLDRRHGLRSRRARTGPVASSSSIRASLIRTGGSATSGLHLIGGDDTALTYLRRAVAAGSNRKGKTMPVVSPTSTADSSSSFGPRSPRCSDQACAAGQASNREPRTCPTIGRWCLHHPQASGVHTLGCQSL